MSAIADYTQDQVEKMMAAPMLVSMYVMGSSLSGPVGLVKEMMAGVDTASALVPAGLTCVGYAVGDDVQLWVDGTANYGWQLHDGNENTTGAGMRYGSRENTDSTVWPVLTVTWNP